ncbi:hypothetical protein METBIDRAFT_30760 [Metschnikowia bicuspidata var. bicuspidata NRRL YB-4993]|uniref:GATA-type domain-containing protein n=1 Tax=Metschnikowia bicuspidata var. bicuspidata NRRL YB-4993 TaxID=869754 RepID=A0A1A0HK04_9ASCO|nr:hypothetical protein METBIDRAFT_30760 [Metschnikowia bicuspidata var. bicuspidata NRRL YB-4993]OBA24509.1 hypothetical protein METBIDRAFT_30760 [Metschnikowia bicuspidata var. bicuspidata NRRL YB-4993]
MSLQDQVHRRMQVKVLYSFDNSPTVFLSRSKNQYSVKVAQIPASSTHETDEFITLGAFDLKSCIQQVVKSSPENFKLQTEDYAVYHKDITEQPDEPFVANGAISSLLNSNKPDLIPGRVCQNLSASFLFGDQANASAMTLEIRLKFHVTSRSEEAPSPKDPEVEAAGRAASSSNSHTPQHTTRRKRPHAGASSEAAIKATRTKSLPIFCHPPNQQISNIINADKLNAAPKYDSKSILERFNLAPFLLAKIIDKPSRYRKRSNIPLTPTVQGSGSLQPQRAMRTRSMISNIQPMISSPINEEALSEATDDTEYNDNNSRTIEEEEEEDEEDEFEANNEDSSSPFTPQQPPYRPSVNVKPAPSAIVRTDGHQFQSLPDLEDLDSKNTHTIPSQKLPPDHDMLCINRNCAAMDSVTWRYFETNFHPSYLNIPRSNPIDMKLFDGMFGPMCNACYLFLRNKGFMRPEAVVKKYLQQQKYKKELKLKEHSSSVPGTVKSHNNSSPFYANTSQSNKFPTPSHVPSAISEVIRNRNSSSSRFPQSASKNLGYARTPQTNEDYQDLNDFVRQLNNFGGPLTDIDMPSDSQNAGEILGVTPPMIATKSNTRVINLCPDEEDKENQPPSKYSEFEQMMIKSFSLKSSPEQNDQNDWAQFFGEPTPKDGNSAAQVINNGITPIFEDEAFDFQRAAISPAKDKKNVVSAVNMPSSPLLSNPQNDHGSKFSESSSPAVKAKRVDTTMSFVNGHRSSPQSEVFEETQKPCA